MMVRFPGRAPPRGLELRGGALRIGLLSVVRPIVLRRAARSAALSQRNPPLFRATAAHSLASLVEPRPLDLSRDRLIGVLLYPPQKILASKADQGASPRMVGAALT